MIRGNSVKQDLYSCLLCSRMVLIGHHWHLDPSDSLPRYRTCFVEEGNTTDTIRSSDWHTNGTIIASRVQVFLPIHSHREFSLHSFGYSDWLSMARGVVECTVDGWIGVVSHTRTLRWHVNYCIILYVMVLLLLLPYPHHSHSFSSLGMGRKWIVCHYDWLWFVIVIVQLMECVVL